MAVKVPAGLLPSHNANSSGGEPTAEGSQAARVALRAAGLLVAGLLLLIGTYALSGGPPEGVLALPLWVTIAGGLLQMAGAIAMWLLPHRREPFPRAVAVEASRAVAVEAADGYGTRNAPFQRLTGAAARSCSAFGWTLSALGLHAQRGARSGWRAVRALLGALQAVFAQMPPAAARHIAMLSSAVVVLAHQTQRVALLGLPGARADLSGSPVSADRVPDAAARLVATTRSAVVALVLPAQRGARAAGVRARAGLASLQVAFGRVPEVVARLVAMMTLLLLALAVQARRGLRLGLRAGGAASRVHCLRLYAATADAVRELRASGAEVGASLPARGIAGWQLLMAQTAVLRPPRAFPGLPEIEVSEWLRRAALRARALTHVSAGVADCIMVIATTCVLFAGLRGIQGNPTPTDLQQPPWTSGPIELSPERGHFALTLSMVEDHSFSFSLPIARYVTPDLGYVNGRYVSLFSPGISFLAIPGYVAGRAVGLAQVGAFAVILLFAEANAILVRLIAGQLGANRTAAWMGALAFIFASPAFVYAVSFFQHHVSLFLLLFPLYLLLKFKSALVLIPVWLMYGYSIVVDYPNALLLAPVAVLGAVRMLRLERTQAVFRAVFNVRAILTLAAIALPLSLLLWFNYQSYGNPLQINSTVATVKAIDDQGHPTTPRELGTSNAQQFLQPNQQNKSVANYFDSRNLLNGLFIHLFSRERGVLVFTPVMFLGIAGACVLVKDRPDKLALILSVVGLNLTLYSLWDDPWGGWAFGSRYIVPSYAMMGILIAIALTKLNRNRLFMGVFAVALVYSLSVNTLGALTTSANPPQAEAASLSQISGHEEKYSWDRDWDYLRTSGTQSILYRAVGSKVVQPMEYYALFATGLSAACLLLLVRVYRRPRSAAP